MLNIRHGLSRSISFSNLLGPLMALALVGAACGGSSDNNSNGGSGTPIAIHGGERLSWDQAASSLQQARAMEYRLYVDGAQSSFSDTRCDTSSTGFQCSGALPSMSVGRHTLEVTAVLNGAESPRSAPLTVSLSVQTQTTQELSKGPVNSSNPAGTSPTCTGADCLSANTLTAGLNGVSALAAAPDGRVFFIAGNDSIGVIADGRLQSEPALQMRDEGARLVGLAVDAQFTRTQSVFVAVADRTDSGVSSLRVVRYRELQGTLGEGATIMSGLPTADNATVPLSMDAGGLLYIALPAAPGGDGNGRILRITRDGSVPAGSSSSTPVLMAGYGVPTGLMFDSSHSRLWLSGQTNGSQQTTSTSFAPAQTSTGGFQQSSAQIQDSAVVAHAAAVAPGMPAAAGGTASFLVIADGQLHRATLMSDGLVAHTTPIQASIDQPVIAATTDRTGSIYVATGTSDGPVSILLLKSR